MSPNMCEISAKRFGFRNGHVINGAWLELCKAQSAAFRRPGIPLVRLDPWSPSHGESISAQTRCVPGLASIPIHFLLDAT